MQGSQIVVTTRYERVTSIKSIPSHLPQELTSIVIIILGSMFLYARVLRKLQQIGLGFSKSKIAKYSN
jgi:hypothetical protein